MNNKKLVAAVAAVAAALICTVAILAVKFGSDNSKPVVAPTVSDYQTTPTTYYNSFTDYSFNAPTASVADSSAPSTSQTLPVIPSQTLTNKVTQAVTKVTQAATELVSVVNKAFNEVFTMPRAPKYIPPDVNIDFNKASLASYKFNPEGNYYYTDDKDCWQKNFGFSEVYDNLAVIGQMYYDTVRTTFNYGGQDWLLQIWKGQYGYCFVGGEVGIYSRAEGKSGSQYHCADKEDWLKMEMAFIWDENKTGNYETIFTRPYDEYWWCTGFVFGFPSSDIIRSRKEFRLISHITFKDTAMANAFCEAFEANGFKRVSKLAHDNLDSFVQVGADVAFVWQNINHHII